ncbi:hypothetical protein [Lactococcus lactis]|uniref:hypothetical protein n=1 Tax=Lactococcus lactis TaxID=1358 RepID=UPI000A406B17|nr:hypothetical protein [Lactococcus lactis]MDG4964801.1 hypothetical protein [Lactococcus lactis]MDT2887897.1 hypothetical protein [Lactococcus lactis]MDT2930677.1 hypothetical protein [Lactococcus lactis]
MSKYKVVMISSDGSREDLDEVFDSYEEASDYARESYNDFSTGAEVLELAGESYIDSTSIEFEVEEI